MKHIFVCLFILTSFNATAETVQIFSSAGPAESHSNSPRLTTAWREGTPIVEIDQPVNQCLDSLNQKSSLCAEIFHEVLQLPLNEDQFVMIRALWRRLPLSRQTEIELKHPRLSRALMAEPVRTMQSRSEELVISRNGALMNPNSEAQNSNEVFHWSFVSNTHQPFSFIGTYQSAKNAYEQKKIVFFEKPCDPLPMGPLIRWSSLNFDVARPAQCENQNRAIAQHLTESSKVLEIEPKSSSWQKWAITGGLIAAGVLILTKKQIVLTTF